MSFLSFDFSNAKVRTLFKNTDILGERNEYRIFLNILFI